MSQLRAGVSGWPLNQSQYERVGINGTAINYGVDIEPQGGVLPVYIADFARLMQRHSIRMSSAPVPPDPPSHAAASAQLLMIVSVILLHAMVF